MGSQTRDNVGLVFGVDVGHGSNFRRQGRDRPIRQKRKTVSTYTTAARSGQSRLLTEAD
jgi:hypothetical protein